jgi:hypothetical protein
MPKTRPATVRASDLPDVATVAEIAAWTRCDPRTLRAEIACGNVPGAFKVGRSIRVLTRVYQGALARTPHADKEEAIEPTSEQ